MFLCVCWVIDHNGSCVVSLSLFMSFALDFYDAIVDEAESRINLIVMLEATEINLNYAFQLFFHVLLNFTLQQNRTDRIPIGTIHQISAGQLSADSSSTGLFPDEHYHLTWSI